MASNNNNIDDDDDYVDEGSDYFEEEDDYYENDDDDIPVEHLITIRGPGYIGDEPFDRNCVFGNQVEMTFHQMMSLTNMVEDAPKPKIKHYVCRITKQNVNESCTMEFTAEFTSYYLTKILRIPHFSPPLVSLVVNCNDSTENRYCRIRIGQLGKATITCGWPAVVSSFNLADGQICVFSFTDERKLPSSMRDATGVWLRLVITKLEENLE